MKTTQVKANAQNAFNAIMSAIDTRITSADNENLKGNFQTEKNKFTLPVIEYAMSINVDVNGLAKKLAISDKKNADFIAIYALQKIRKTLTALSQGIASSADGYTHTILFNLLHGKQNNKTALVSLSRGIEFTEKDTQEIIKMRHTCSANTAGTQASSSRMMMLHLNIASVTKGKVNDVFTLLDNDITKRVREVFAKDVELKTK